MGREVEGVGWAEGLKGQTKVSQLPLTPARTEGEGLGHSLPPPPPGHNLTPRGVGWGREGVGRQLVQTGTSSAAAVQICEGMEGM